MPKLTRTQIVILACMLIAICILAAVICFLSVQMFWPFKSTETPGTTTVAPGDIWSQIQNSGKIVIGTSADYPPFEYYSQDFKLDGFDIAMMRQIAAELDLQVEFKDMAFDGLFSALQINQADAVIAAISVNPDREALVDFTMIYYVGDDGALAKSDSTITLTSADDLASYRLGVQSGSVYQSWVHTNLIQPGKMPEANLFAYPLIEQALEDLKQGRIDLVVMDLAPAQSFAASGEYKIAGQSLNQQKFAIAVKKGESALLTQLNNTLADMQDKGVISQLAQQYLNIAPPQPGQPTPTPLPTSTPAPTQPPQAPTSTPPSACVDGMAFIQDLSYPDFNMTAPPIIPPGTPFQKGWRLRNTGTCTWNNSYTLIYSGGNSPYSSMSGQPTPILGQVPPGATYDMYISLISPPVPGTYQGFWVLQNTVGQAFGQKIWVGITVPAPVFPTQTPSTDIFFDGQPRNINSGDRVLFTWQVQNAQAVYFYADGEVAQQSGSQNFIGQAEVYPTQTTTYNLMVVKPSNQSETRQITIFVTGGGNPPSIDAFTVEPNQVDLGVCVTIKWRVSGQVSTVDLTKDGTVLWDTAPLAGSINDCPNAPGTVNYSLQVKGPGGTSQSVQSVQVNPLVMAPVATP